MRICGIQGVSAIDFPGRIASVLFLGGCNFRCPFCQNPDLVLNPESLLAHDLDDVVRSIERRRGLVDGVVVTGGEPLIHGGCLLGLLRCLRDAGLAVKLDTNGYEVDSLGDVLKQGLVDFVAMDVKTSLSKYEQAAGRSLDVGRIREAVSAIRESGVEHEFRTTCVPGLVEQSDIESVATLLGGAERYVLQQFRATSQTIDPSYTRLSPYPPGTLEFFARTARPFVASVALRGV